MYLNLRTPGTTSYMAEAQNLELVVDKPQHSASYAVRITVIITFIIGLLPLPHVCYVILHSVIFFISLLSLGSANWKRRPAWTSAVVAVCIIYNPFFPVHLDRALWIVVNIPTAVLFFYLLDEAAEVASRIAEKKVKAKT